MIHPTVLHSYTLVSSLPTITLSIPSPAFLKSTQNDPNPKFQLFTLSKTQHLPA